MEASTDEKTGKAVLIGQAVSLGCVDTYFNSGVASCMKGVNNFAQEIASFLAVWIGYLHASFTVGS